MFCVQLIRYEREDEDGSLRPVVLRGHDDDAATAHVGSAVQEIVVLGGGGRRTPCAVHI